VKIANSYCSTRYAYTDCYPSHYRHTLEESTTAYPVPFLL
jgi:hypothetical protein